MRKSVQRLQDELNMLERAQPEVKTETGTCTDDLRLFVMELSIFQVGSNKDGVVIQSDCKKNV